MSFFVNGLLLDLFYTLHEQNCFLLLFCFNQNGITNSFFEIISPKSTNEFDDNNLKRETNLKNFECGRGVSNR